MTGLRLTNTLPSPKAARSHLIEAKKRVRVCETNLTTAKDAVKTCRGIVDETEAARRVAEDDLESDDSPANDTKHARAHLAWWDAVAALLGSVSARKSARAALKEAEGERGRADEELKAVREGRRSDGGKAANDPDAVRPEHR